MKPKHKPKLVQSEAWMYKEQSKIYREKMTDEKKAEIRRKID